MKRTIKFSVTFENIPDELYTAYGKYVKGFLKHEALAQMSDYSESDEEQEALSNLDVPLVNVYKSDPGE